MCIYGRRGEESSEVSPGAFKHIEIGKRKENQNGKEGEISEEGGKSRVCCPEIQVKKVFQV